MKDDLKSVKEIKDRYKATVRERGVVWRSRTSRMSIETPRGDLELLPLLG